MRLRTALGAGPGRAPVLDLLEEVELRRQDGAVVVVVCAAREPRVSAAAEQARGQPALGTLTALARARGPAGPQTRGCMLSAGPSHAPLWSGVPSCAKHAELTVYGPRAALPAGSAQTHPACRQGAPRPPSNLPGSPACQAAQICMHSLRMDPPGGLLHPCNVYYGKGSPRLEHSAGQGGRAVAPIDLTRGLALVEAAHGARVRLAAGRHAHPARLAAAARAAHARDHGRLPEHPSALVRSGAQPDAGAHVFSARYAASHTQGSTDGPQVHIRPAADPQGWDWGRTCCGCCGGDESGRKYVNSSSRSRCARNSSATCAACSKVAAAW